MFRPFALLLLLTCGAAQTRPAIDPAAAPGFASISVQRMRADLAFLTSEPLAGRMSLERGSEVAIQWIAAEFTKAGLKPGNGDSYLQPLGLTEYHPDAAGMRLALLEGEKRSEYKFAEGFIGSFPDNTTISGDLVFAGYGITAPEFGYDDYAGIDVNGKIAVIFDHEPQENDPKSVFNGVGNTRHANSRLKILNAQKHGAIAILLVPEPNRTHPSNLERQMKIPGYAERLTKFASQALSDNPLKIPLFTITDATAKDVFSAAGKSPSELQSQIDSGLKPASMPLPGARVEMTVVNANRRQGTSFNVIGVLEGSDSDLKADTIIYSGHFDHDGIRDGKIYPGADDNATGTVAVVELARAFAKNGLRPKRSVMFIVFAAEERGILGSYYYVDHPLRPLESTRAVINFDMIGRNEAPSSQTEGVRKMSADTSNELGLIGTIYSPSYRAVVEKQNRSIGLDLTYTWDNDAALNVFQRSDQFPFALRDIPAMWWFTGFHPDYHQPTDTIEKINFPKMEKIVKLAYLTGWAWASDAATLPRFSARTSR